MGGKTTKEKLEEKAQEFVAILSDVHKGGKKQALEYYDRLSSASQDYIKKNEKYKWMLQSARMQF